MQLLDRPIREKEKVVSHLWSIYTYIYLNNLNIFLFDHRKPEVEIQELNIFTMFLILLRHFLLMLFLKKCMSDYFLNKLAW